MKKRKSPRLKYINGVAHIKLCEGFGRNSRGRMVCKSFGWIPRSRVTVFGSKRDQQRNARVGRAKAAGLGGIPLWVRT